MRQTRNSGPPLSSAPASAAAIDGSTAPPAASTRASAGSRFLPFGVSGPDEATYLRQFVELGGADAQQYKMMSYELLQLEAGQRVLDIGCGIGVDLLPLIRLVGQGGQVTGLDTSAERLRAAQETIGERGNIQLVEGNVEQMPFADGSFERVRADRVLLHVPHLQRALSEMYRVLSPEGVAVVVEPDWKAVALYPASPAAGDDDHTWSAIVQLCQRRLPHALIGRQLSSLFLTDHNTSWKDVQIEARVYILNAWPVTNAILQVTQLAQALAQEDATRAHEVETWLQLLEAASNRGEFLAAMPLFFARARKGQQ